MFALKGQKIISRPVLIAGPLPQMSLAGERAVVFRLVTCLQPGPVQRREIPFAWSTSPSCLLVRLAQTRFKVAAAFECFQICEFVVISGNCRRTIANDDRT